MVRTLVLDGALLRRGVRDFARGALLQLGHGILAIEESDSKGNGETCDYVSRRTGHSRSGLLERALCGWTSYSVQCLRAGVGCTHVLGLDYVHVDEDDLEGEPAHVDNLRGQCSERPDVGGCDVNSRSTSKPAY